jgi:hypothetical protein
VGPSRAALRASALRSQGLRQTRELPNGEDVSCLFDYRAKRLNIGVAFPHEDGKGFNVMLQALPIHGNGKIVLREHDQKDQAEDEADRDNGKRSGGGNSRGRDRNDQSDRRTERR